MKEIKLVVLDVDGVLRDSSKIFYECHKSGMGSVGLAYEFASNFDVKDVWHFKGLGRFNNKRDALNAMYSLIKMGEVHRMREIIYKPNAEQMISKMVDQGWVRPDEATSDKMVDAYKKTATSERIGDFVLMYPDLEKIIMGIKQKKKVGIFTNSDLIIVKRDLKELLSEFDYVITPKDVKVSKPSGEGLRLISQMSGIHTENILYIGDTVVDIWAAKDAGCISAVVLNGMGLEAHLKREGPELVFKDLKDASDWILLH